MKVVAISGERLTLSMRDVDQSTGEDLLPGARLGAEGINPSGPAANCGCKHQPEGPVWHQGVPPLPVLSTFLLGKNKPQRCHAFV